MSYAIVRNEKHTQGKTQRSDTHNERKSKNHSNKDIDPETTYLNFYFKKPKSTYVKEFQRIKEENNLKGQIKSNSNITCEYMVTSDKKFFDSLGYEETKRYFEESYKFLCNYKNLGEKYVISAMVHMDEGDPHMHFVYVPVIHTKDKQGNNIDKLSCRDFWKGQNSYRALQDSFYEYITSKGFQLERGQASELTKRQHYTVEEFKRITNYENTKQILQDITLELPEVPDIKDMSKFVLGRDEKILKQIIEPKDNLIKELYSDNVELHKELSKQANIMDKAEKYEKEQDTLLAENKKLKLKCSDIEKVYTRKIEKLEDSFQTKISDLEKDLENRSYEIKAQANKDFYRLEKENRNLRRIVNTVQDTIHKFITWVCKKFSVSVESVVRDFEKESRSYLDPLEQIKHEDRQKEDELEL